MARRRRSKKIQFEHSDFEKLSDENYIRQCLDSYRRENLIYETLSNGDRVTCLGFLMEMAGHPTRPRDVIASNRIYEFADIPHALDPHTPQFIEFHLNNIYPFVARTSEGKKDKSYDANSQRMAKFYAENHRIIPDLACRSDRYDYKKNNGTISCLEEIIDRDRTLSYPFDGSDAHRDVCHISRHSRTSTRMKSVTCGEKVIHQAKYSHSHSEKFNKVKYSLSYKILSKFAQSNPIEYLRWMYSDIPSGRYRGDKYIEQLAAHHPADSHDTGDGEYTFPFNLGGGNFAAVVVDAFSRASEKANPNEIRELREYITAPLVDPYYPRNYIMAPRISVLDEYSRNPTTTIQRLIATLKLPILAGYVGQDLVQRINQRVGSISPETEDYEIIKSTIRNAFDVWGGVGQGYQWLERILQNQYHGFSEELKSIALETLRQNKGQIKQYVTDDALYFKIFGEKMSAAFKDATIQLRMAEDEKCQKEKRGDPDIYKHLLNPGRKPYNLNPDPHDLVGVYEINLKESYLTKEIQEYSNSVTDLWNSLFPIIDGIKTNVPCGDGRADVTVRSKLNKYDPNIDDLSITIEYVTDSGAICGSVNYPVLKVLSDFPKSIKREIMRADIKSYNKLQGIINLRKQAPREEADYKMIISNKSSDIFRASACQHWDNMSCLRPVPHGGYGFHRWALKSFADFGSYIAYLVSSSPYEPKWLARMFIHQCKDGTCLQIQPSHYSVKPHHGQILNDAVQVLFNTKEINKKCTINSCDNNHYPWIVKNIETYRELKEKRKATHGSAVAPGSGDLTEYPQLYDHWVDRRECNKIRKSDVDSILKRRVSGMGPDAFVKRIAAEF